MESKYKERAKEILESVYDTDYRNSYKTNYPEQCIIEAMCQLANEVAFYSVAEGMDMVFKNLIQKNK